LQKSFNIAVFGAGLISQSL